MGSARLQQGWTVKESANQTPTCYLDSRAIWLEMERRRADYQSRYGRQSLQWALWVLSEHGHLMRGGDGVLVWASAMMVEAEQMQLEVCCPEEVERLTCLHLKWI